MRPQRNDLIAALILDAPTDGHKLSEIWRTYMPAHVFEVLVDEEDTTGPVDLNNFKRR